MGRARGAVVVMCASFTHVGNPLSPPVNQWMVTIGTIQCIPRNASNSTLPKFAVLHLPTPGPLFPQSIPGAARMVVGHTIQSHVS